VQRDDLIGALSGHRDNDVYIRFDGARLPIGSVTYADDDDIIDVQADGRGVWQIQYRYYPENDDDLLPATVDQLRELWAEHREHGRTVPDFYAWAVQVLRKLYLQGALAVALPVDVDPEQPCKCEGTPAEHRPRTHPRCLYTREVTS
jgi:hypothetical protein